MTCQWSMENGYTLELYIGFFFLLVLTYLHDLDCWFGRFNYYLHDLGCWFGRFNYQKSLCSDVLLLVCYLIYVIGFGLKEEIAPVFSSIISYGYWF